jgi:hypothetical protein
LTARLANGGVKSSAAVNPFRDVAPGAYYYSAAVWASENGVAQGSDGNFRPSSPITRQEMAAMIARFLKVTYEPYTGRIFADDADISPWAKSALYVCTRLDILRGYDDGSVLPAAVATRAQAAAIFNRVMAMQP